MKGKYTAWIGMGSNSGKRFFLLQQALNEMRKEALFPVRVSRVYETTPLGFKADKNFLNAVTEIKTDWEAGELLQKLLFIEKKLGRIRSIKKESAYESRKIDLDVLLFDQQVVNTDLLRIPHPEMTNRQFVLIPLNELIPNMQHPLTKHTITHHLNTCIDKSKPLIYNKQLSVHY